MKNKNVTAATEDAQSLAPTVKHRRTDLVISIYFTTLG